MSMGELNLVIPDVPEPILGHRAFITQGRYLRSIQPWGSTWPVNGPLQAECRYYDGKFVDGFHGGCDETPCGNPRLHTGYGCGLYSFTDLETLAKHYPADRFILGQVLISGAVYQHANGYRSERGRVHAIYHTGKLTERVYAEYYGVPLIDLDPDQLDMWKREWARQAESARASAMRHSGAPAKTSDMVTWLDLAACVASVGVGFADSALRRVWRKIRG